MLSNILALLLTLHAAWSLSLLIPKVDTAHYSFHLSDVHGSNAPVSWIKITYVGICMAWSRKGDLMRQSEPRHQLTSCVRKTVVGATRKGGQGKVSSCQAGVEASDNAHAPPFPSPCPMLVLGT